MTHPLSFRGAALATAVLAAVLLAGPAARAQGAIPVPGTNANGRLVGPVEQPREQVNKTLAAPPAIPGAATQADGAAPVARPPNDMRPNEALFDAINRGDIATVREAIKRGADLYATNVLGLTPTELSVDLGRNDITFLLLSQRGASPSGPRPAAVANQAPPAKVAAKASSRPPARPAPRPAPAVAAAAPPAVPVRQYADVPATPVPQVGFLGFGGVTR
jgi:hypothetical protein